MSELPPGFVLDKPDTGLPPGFVLDQPSILEDAAKSVGAGLANATAGTLGMAGDVRSLLSAGTSALGDKLSVGADRVQMFKDIMSKAAGMTGAGSVLANAPTSRQIKETATDPIVSPDYEPKTVVGGYLKTGAEFLPGMAVGGPRAFLPRLATNVAAPAIASETAGQFTKGTDAEPYARVGGALVGAGGASAAARIFEEMAAARRVVRSVPSAENTIKTAKGQFKAAEDMDLAVTPDWATSAAAKIRNDLKGFDPEAQGAVFKATDRLENLGTTKAPQLSPLQRLELEMNGLPLPSAPPSSPVAMNDVELIRKQLTAMKTNTDASVREAARKAITSLQESQLALTPVQTLRGNADLYTKTLSDAIGNYAAGKRSNTVMGKVALGDLNAATAGSGANEDNALRQAIKQLVRPVNNDIVPKASRLGFNTGEIKAMNKVARGTMTGNTARALGKMAPTGIVSGALSGGAGFAAGGPVGAVALPAAGYVAKKIGDLSTKRAVDALDSLVRSRSPLAQQVAEQLPPAVVNSLPAKTRGLLGRLQMQNSLLNAGISGLLARPQQ